MPQIIPITNLDIPELDIYAHHSEPQLLHYYEPDPGVFIAESPIVIERALEAGYTPLSMLLDEKQVHDEAKKIISLCGDVPIYTASGNLLKGITGFPMTRGALCAMRRKPLCTAADFLFANPICRELRRIAILENVVNPTNIGAIFRSAAALNIDAVLLTPACCDPLYRRAIRVSMGNVFLIPWTWFSSDKESWPEKGLALLKKAGFATCALALTDDSVSIDHPDLMAEEKLAIILGTEGDGLAASTIAASDYTAKIPMTNGVDSLNVAAASAVAFWQLTRQY